MTMQQTKAPGKQACPQWPHGARCHRKPQARGTQLVGLAHLAHCSIHQRVSGAPLPPGLQQSKAAGGWAQPNTERAGQQACGAHAAPRSAPATL